jgi:peptidoglycan/LPS O-acetylase OafA/YrhL
MNRIGPIDGLRTFAVIGVIWAHVWMFFGNLPLLIAGVNVNQLLSFGGIGVDLFFVISGFCMYLMHEKESLHFSAGVYGRFLKKRWLRIAPAFYFIVLFECFVYLSDYHLFPWKSLVYHLLFINTFNPDNVLSPPFWSLATEWHFYMILPLLFIADPLKKRLVPRVLVLIGVCMVLRSLLYYRYPPLSGVTVRNDQIWYRFAEFGFGILASWFYIKKKKLWPLLEGNAGFILSFLIAYAGRLFMANEVLSHFGKMAFLARAVGEPILAFGFSLMILNLVNTASLFRRFVSARPFLFLGRISYSMYLWHWMIVVGVTGWWISRIGHSVADQELAFILAVLLCIPVAMLSYRWLEAPYFKKRKKTNALPVAQGL